MVEDYSRDRTRSSDTWVEYRRLVLAQLEGIQGDIQTIYGKLERIRSDDLAQIKTDIVLLKFQAALWGAFGGVMFGALSTIITSIITKTLTK